MIVDGLALWLDAADAKTLDVAADGTVQAWRDKGPAKRVALPVAQTGAVKWVENALNGPGRWCGATEGRVCGWRISSGTRGP